MTNLKLNDDLKIIIKINNNEEIIRNFIINEEFLQELKNCKDIVEDDDLTILSIVIENIIEDFNNNIINI